MANDQNKVLIVAVLALVGLVAWQSGVFEAGGAQEGEKIERIGGCPDSMTTSIGTYAVKSVKSTDGEEVEIESNAPTDVYLKGDTSAYDTISAGSGYQFGAESLTCGSDSFRMIAGNGADYYHKEGVDGKEMFEATNAKQKYKFVLDEVGTMDVTADTASNFGQSSGSITLDVSAGGTYSDLEFNVKENSGAVVKKPTIFFDYNTTAVDDVELIGGQKVESIPTRLSGYEKGYKMTKDRLENYGKVEDGAKITMSSDYDGTAETITAKVDDVGTYVSEGKIHTGYEDLSDADIGATNVEYTFSVNAS